MRKILLNIFLLIGLSSAAYAQKTYSIKGIVFENQTDSVPGASVMLLDLPDSTLLLYTSSTKNGSFELKEIPNGKYLLQISSVGMPVLYKNIEVTGADLNLGNLDVSQGVKKLDEVLIEDYLVPVVIKGDTIEYNADAFKTKPNAVAEDLLKKLPGVEVDKDGNIKAQGEDVQKILVDGKEFFGTDPKMATKNLPADAIDKVQVYDKKSEEAEQTGIDDGEHEKTINLTLKKNKKQGIFGSVEASYAHENLYYGKIKLFRFSGKTQISVLGLGNNMNESGFDWSDYADFMGGWQNAFSGMDEGFDFGNLGLPIGGSNQGVSSAYSGGLNLNHQFTKRTKLSLNYSINRGIHILNSEENRQYNNSDNPYSTFETEDANQRNYTHRAGFKFDIALDSSSEIKIKSNLSYLTQNDLKVTSQNTYTNSNILENQAYTDNVSDVTALKASGSLQYRKKFGNPRRNISVGGDFVLNPYDGSVRLYSLKDFRINDSIPYWLHDTLHQEQIAEQEQFSWGANFSFVEPVSPNSHVQFQYKFNTSERDQLKNYFDIPSSGENQLNDTLSGNYKNNYSWHNASVGWTLRKNDHFLLIGLAGQVSDLSGKVAISDTLITKQFRNLLPRFRYNYKFSKTSRFSLNYNTRINEPNVAQLQPVIDNSNPFKLYIGNPDLKAEYSHRGRLEYSSFSQFSYTTCFISGSVGYTRNKISTAVTTDSNFIQTSSPVNVDYEVNYDGYVYYDFPIKPLKIKMELSAGLSGSQSLLYVNGLLDNVNRLSPDFEVGIENRKKENFDISVGLEYSIKSSKYATNANLNQTFYSYSPYLYLEVFLGDNWTFSTDFDWSFYKGNAFNKDQDIALWEAAISYQFLKNKVGELELSVFDILNQYRGFEQNSSVNYILEKKYNTLSRYFMLSFTYSIKRMNGKHRD
ncbi:MAG: outer membrane beta-barrel protein [Flavobacteriales bacterium]